jgi:cellobiose-specific phosphotransferase system component IIC
VIPDQYIWLAWACSFLVPWVALFTFFPQHRRVMWWASLFTAPFGLTEPIFVPAYWNPPSLFNLAQTTGFDIESLIFCFGIGGVGAVTYDVLTRRVDQPMSEEEKREPLHRHHYKALAAPWGSFLVLYWFPWNPIYPSLIAMLIGAVTTVACRPHLKTKTYVGGLIFLAIYVLFLQFLELMSPGYIARVWNLQALTGIQLFYMPLEELLFAIFFGMYWSGVYEHFTWMRAVPIRDQKQVPAFIPRPRKGA